MIYLREFSTFKSLISMETCCDLKKQSFVMLIKHELSDNLHFSPPFVHTSLFFPSVCSFNQASNNSISSLPGDLAKCSKLTKLDVEVLKPYWLYCLMISYSLALGKSCLTVSILLSSWQGNKLTLLPESLIASCRMLTELNACKTRSILFTVLPIDS